MHSHGIHPVGLRSLRIPFEKRGYTKKKLCLLQQKAITPSIFVFFILKIKIKNIFLFHIEINIYYILKFYKNDISSV